MCWKIYTVELQKLDFVVDGISLARPNNSKPKGRTIKGSEQKVIRLGAKGTKKMNRKCQKCGIADGHNSRTCLSLEENRLQLASLAGRKRGRPPGSRNKGGSNTPHWNETTTSKNTQLILIIVSQAMINMLYVIRIILFLQ
jgi:hypothetical protein